MNKYLILGSTMDGCDKNYKGTYRSHPSYVDNEDKDSEVNKYFFWYLKTTEDLDIVTDLDKARNLVKLYTLLDPPQNFEVIKIYEKEEEPCEGEEFLGFDLSDCFDYSLLCSNLNLRVDDKKHEGAYKKILPLLMLIKEYFRPKLNKYSLFDDYKTAKFCLKCMMSLQLFYPNLWESEDYKFDVIGLSRIIK
jgi:hypothetical protein